TPAWCRAAGSAPSAARRGRAPSWRNEKQTYRWQNRWTGVRTWSVCARGSLPSLPTETAGGQIVKIFGQHQLAWRGDALYCGGRAVLHIVLDARHSSMWRVRGDGRLSDMVNRARAKDAAMSMALAELNREETGAAAPPMRSSQWSLPL